MSNEKRKRIILVDDDPGVRDVITIILERVGYEVAVSTNGSCILEPVGPHPDAYLIDTQLQSVDGLNLCRHLKHATATQSIPVVMVSATCTYRNWRRKQAQMLPLRSLSISLRCKI